MTTSTLTTILVEGKSDFHFVRQYAKHLGYDSDLQYIGKTSGIVIREVGGIGALTGKKISPDIIQDARKSDKVLIIADANDDIQKRRKKLQNTAQKIMTNAQLFLLPDDKTPGMLEDLLIAIFRDDGVGGCFEEYKKCLRDKKLHPPGAKGEIYAYCEAHKTETDADKRDYRNPEFWDLEHSALKPLRGFLCDNLSPDDKREE